MRSLRHVSLLCLVAAVVPVAACAAQSPDEEETGRSEDEVKKKVNPKAGNGALDFTKPTWAATNAVGSYLINEKPVAFDSRTEMAPTWFFLQTKPDVFADGKLMNHVYPKVVIQAGKIETRMPSGLKVRFDKPLTLGAARFDMVPEVPGGAGFLKGKNGAWSRRAAGVTMFAAPGKLTFTNAAAGSPSDVTIAEGKLQEIVLPTAAVKVQVDAYDADYPTPRECPSPSIRAGAGDDSDAASVRSASGVGFAGAVVPQGANAPIVLDTYGVRKSFPTVAGQTVNVVMNRLEVNHVDVSVVSGGTRLVPGTFTVTAQVAAGTQTLNCRFPTQSGIDLPDGRYWVTTYATVDGGVVTHTEQVSFP